VRIGVVIPVHNQGEYFDRCLASMRESGDDDVRLYVIDAASRPGEVRMDHAVFPYRLHRYDVNPGVTKPWNKGLEMALSDGAEVVCIANSDILWGVETIARCAAEAAEHLAAFPLTVESGPAPAGFDRMARLLAYQPDVALTAQEAELHLQGATPRNRSILLELLVDPTKRVNAPTGGFAGWCFFLSARCMERAGVFDEQFVLWYQDNDYLRRLASAGIRPVECRNCLIHHFESKSILGLEDGFDHQGWRERDAERWKAKWK